MMEHLIQSSKEAGGGTPNFQASASGNPGSSNPNDSRKAGGGTPNFQAPQIAQQSSNFTSGNPGSSTSASNKGKSTNFSKESNPDNWSLSSITGSASHYGDAMPSQQVPPMDDDTLVPSQAGTDSMNWLGENLQSNDEDLDSVVRPKNTSLFKRALGFMSSLGGASPQEPQFSPSMHDTSAASSYYPSNQPDDQTLESMVTPRNQKGFDGTPFLPNQSQSTGWPGASNFFSPTPNTSNFNSGNPGSSAIPFQQVPMPGTLIEGAAY
uniref:Ovule protein n=1 Tax=Globodera pallida TaxID=36090 RepID=A0A183C2U5_GLOPA